MSYVEEASYSTYRAELDLFGISDTTMTDAGTPVEDLLPLRAAP